jgi:predicted nucleic acid-binding protein
MLPCMLNMSSRGMTLLTRNLCEFQRVPGLAVEDWPISAA